MAGNVARLSLLVLLCRSFLISIMTSLFFTELVYFFKISFISANKKFLKAISINFFHKSQSKAGLMS